MNRDAHIRIECAMSERLIERCARSGMRLRRVDRIGDRTIDVYCSAGDARALMEFCERYHVNARQLQSAKKSRLMARMRRRWTILPGMALCIVIMAAFLGRVWLIDVTIDGQTAADGSRSEVLTALADRGVQVGMPVGGIDPQALQKQLTARFEDACFVGVRRQGIRLTIELQTEISPPETYDISRAGDLVAARDGIITAIDAECGRACVEIGDTVRTGQTLIRGEEAVSGEETRAVAARGSAMASCWIEGSAVGNLTEAVTERTGRQCAATSMRILNLTIPLLKGEMYEAFESERRVIPIVGMFLPLEMVRDTRHETRTVQRQIDSPELIRQLSALARADARAGLADGDLEMIKSWENITSDGSTVTVRAVTEFSTDIATERKEYGRINPLGKH